MICKSVPFPMLVILGVQIPKQQNLPLYVKEFPAQASLESVHILNLVFILS